MRSKMNLFAMFVATIAAVINFGVSEPFSAISVNRINAYRQLLPQEFDIETISRLKPSRLTPTSRFATAFEFTQSYGLNPEPGSGGTKRAHLLRLANQAARGFGK